MVVVVPVAEREKSQTKIEVSSFHLRIGISGNIFLGRSIVILITYLFLVQYKCCGKY